FRRVLFRSISSFPPDKRGTAMGLFSLVMFFAPAIGPTVSGIVVENYSWHVLFYMMIPVLIIVLVVGFWQLPEIQQKREAHIDIMSIVLSTIGFGRSEERRVGKEGRAGCGAEMRR